MARKSIFEILADDWDVEKEIERIEVLLTETIFVGKVTAAYLIDKYAFKTWKQRFRCIDHEEFRDRLNINDIVNEIDPSVQETLIYLEYALNMFYLLLDVTENYGAVDEDAMNMLESNINTLIDHLNYKSIYYPDEEKAILVEKNAATTAVAEIVDKDLAIKVVEYNHFTLKGDLPAKKNILLALANELEPARQKIKAFNSSLDDLFTLFNNMNIRHNNCVKGKNYNAYVASLTDEQLEEWYDEIYQMALLARLCIDHIPRKQKVDTLKQQL